MKTNRFNYPNLGFSSGLSQFIQDAFVGLEHLGGALASADPNQTRLGIDLYQDENHFYATLELPGISKSDIKVEFADGTLDVAASLSKETASGRKNIPLKRSLVLPDPVGDGEVTAKLEDGILTVTLPKSEAAKPRTITIE
jgi:HSP20 family protein